MNNDATIFRSKGDKVEHSFEMMLKARKPSLHLA